MREVSLFGFVKLIRNRNRNWFLPARRLSQVGYELRNRVEFVCWSGSTEIYFRREGLLQIVI